MSAPDLRKCRELLGVEPDASKERLKQAYHELAKVWHPDRFPDDVSLQARAQEKLKDINAAYKALSSADPGASRPAFSASTPYRDSSIPDPHVSVQAADERFLRSATWIIVVLMAIAALVYAFYIYGKPFQTVSVEKPALRHIV